LKEEVMKKMVLISCLVFAGLFSYGQPKSIQGMQGRWEFGGEENSGAYLEIIDSATIYLNYMGERKKLSDCRIDFSKSPAWFDFSTQDTASVVHIKTLLEIVNESTIKWQLFLDEERPAYFSASKGELYYLKKSNISAPTMVRN
jgi:hypothetical protein